MDAKVVKRSISIAGHKTSITLEEPFWTSLHEIASSRGRSVSQLLSEIQQNARADDPGNFSSAVRLYILGYCWHLAALPPRAATDSSLEKWRWFWPKD
jgi:predicted DNA-binding ribbon-helix-helix protein